MSTLLLALVLSAQASPYGPPGPEPRLTANAELVHKARHLRATGATLLGTGAALVVSGAAMMSVAADQGAVDGWNVDPIGTTAAGNVMAAGAGALLTGGLMFHYGNEKDRRVRAVPVATVHRGGAGVGVVGRF